MKTRAAHLFKVSGRVLVLFVYILVFLTRSTPALAYDALDKQTPFYKPGVASCAGDLFPSGNGSGTAAATEVQVNNAKIVMGIAKTDNLGQEGALIGLMVALAESTLTNLANTNVPVSLNIPHEGVGSDHDSVGVFQQRPSTNWSTIASGPAADSNQAAVAQLMNPAYAAQAFFGSPPGSSAPSALSKGLQNITNWQSLTPGQAAQKVQASGTPDGANYTRQQAAAQKLLTKYWESAPAIPLVIPVSGGSSSTGDGSAGQDGCAGSIAPGPIAGCTNPFSDPGWSPARTDQGVDYAPTKVLPVRAICDGTIISTNGSGWPGGYFILIKLTAGPFAGKCTFVAEHLANVLPKGTDVKAGQEIGTALPGYPWTEWGWASGPQTPSTRYNGAPDGTAMPGGKAFARFLRHLGATTKEDPGPGLEYEGNSCP